MYVHGSVHRWDELSADLGGDGLSADLGGDGL